MIVSPGEMVQLSGLVLAAAALAFSAGMGSDPRSWAMALGVGLMIWGSMFDIRGAIRDDDEEGG